MRRYNFLSWWEPTKGNHQEKIVSEQNIVELLLVSFSLKLCAVTLFMHYGLQSLDFPACYCPIFTALGQVQGVVNGGAVVTEKKYGSKWIQVQDLEKKCQELSKAAAE